MNLTHRIVNGEVCRRMVVHQFTVSDVEDPDIYAAGPILEWKQSEAGKYVIEHAVECPEFHQQMDHTVYGYRYAITAWLRERDLTYYCLRWC